MTGLESGLAMSADCPLAAIFGAHASLAGLTPRRRYANERARHRAHDLYALPLVQKSGLTIPFEQDSKYVADCAASKRLGNTWCRLKQWFL
jgi:hypothetical protein